MKIYVHSASELNDRVDIFGMAVVSPKVSGLKNEIWLDPAGKDRNVPHNRPRIKVRVGNDRVPFAIDNKPCNLTRINVPDELNIIKWIKRNADVLLQHWNREISDDEVIPKLKKLSDKEE